MGKILVIKGVDFSATSIETVKLVADKISINVLANPTEGGICTGTGVYDEGTQINISATPNNKYEFDSWDDGDTNLQRTIIVDELKDSDNWTAELNTDGKRYALVSVFMNDLKDPKNLNVSGTRK